MPSLVAIVVMPCSPLLWFPFELPAYLRSQISAVYCTLEDRRGPFRLHGAHDNFVEPRPSEQKMRCLGRTELLVAEPNRRENGEHNEKRQNDELR